MKKNVLLVILLSSILLSARGQNSNVSIREFLKINSYPIINVAEYYSDITNFLMITPTQEKEGKFGYLFSDGKLFKSPEFNYASDFRYGYANIIKDSIPGLLYKNGKVKYFPKYSLTYWNNDKLGLAIKNNKYGFIDKNGNLIVPLIYDDAFPFYDGYASVKKGEKWFYIDKKGNEIQSLKTFETTYKPIIENKVLISDEKRNKIKKGILTTTTTGMTEYITKVNGSDYPENLFDLLNKKILNFSDYDEISGYFEQGLMKVVKDKKVGFVDLNKKIVIPLIYDQVKDVSEDKITVKRNGFWGSIDLNNNIVIPFEFSYLSNFHDGLAFFSKDLNAKTIGYLDSSNQIAIQPDLEFSWYGNFNNGIAVAKKEGKYGYINKSGQFILPNIYKEAFPFTNGKALVQFQDTGKYTFINQTGENILKDNYKQLYPIKNGFARYIE